MSALHYAAAACALAYLFICNRDESLFRSVLKTASVAILALVALVAGGPVLLVAALALCGLGDWLLSRPGDGSFMAGVGAFAAGHLAYIALFLTHPLADLSLLAHTPRLRVMVALALLGLFMARLLGPRAGDLRGPVLAYIPIILGMGAAVLVLPLTGPLIWAGVGAALFIGSDMMLATDKFVLGDRHPLRAVAGYAVWSTYWLAQFAFLIAFT